MPVMAALHLQDILRGLDQQQVDPALDQADGLLAEDVGQLVEGDVGKLGIVGGGQLAGGPDRAGHEARLSGLRRQIFIRQAARQRGRGPVDLEHPLRQAVFAQGDAVGAEGVGLDHIHADLQEGAVHLLDRLGVADHQVIVAAVGALAAKLLGGQLLLLAGWCPSRHRRPARAAPGRPGSGGWCRFCLSQHSPVRPGYKKRLPVGEAFPAPM